MKETTRDSPRSSTREESDKVTETSFLPMVAVRALTLTVNVSFALSFPCGYTVMVVVPVFRPVTTP